MIYFLAFAMCMPIANWLIGNLGTVCIPDGPILFLIVALVCALALAVRS